MEKYLKDFKGYIERMQKVRLLSKPDLKEIGDSGEYSKTLVRNFSEIGDLAKVNRKVMDAYVNPVLSGRKNLDDEEREKIDSINELLVEKSSFEEVDAHLSEVLTDLLMDDIDITENSTDDERVLAMAGKVKRDYMVIAELTRFINDDTESIRAAALENRELLNAYIKPDAFKTLGEEAKGAALQFSLMGVLLYENNLQRQPEEYWEKAFDILQEAEEILQAPFYREVFPDYGWDTYEFRIYYYGAMLADSLLPRRAAEKAYEYAKRMESFLQDCTNEIILAAVNVEQAGDLMYLASVQAGRTPVREASEKFYRGFQNRDSSDYSVTGVNKNLDPPSSYMITAKMMGLELGEIDYDRIFEIQKSMLDYLYHIPNRADVYMKSMTLFANLPMYFMEVPGAMTLEEFCINAFAAVHPPTYVHVNMVARMAECMSRHLLELMPELFIGFPGCPDAASVRDQKDRIIDYTFHSALCHDLGKLFIIDTISMYGRSLLDTEFLTIKHHPMIGARLAAEHHSTKDYADVILGHHIWYDCSRGYPDNFDTRKSPYKAVIDIVLVADCLDAATDTVGRSYSRGKTFAEFEKEVEEGLGMHYAPFFAELFKQPSFRSDIEYLLNEGRERMYRDTYDHIMKHA
ncbi:MAG: hypothetical protein IK115_01700 [Lachnospiraceae bacterium]|nr:hypothetical protein [Lachnospiraceae bacterium]